MQTYTIAVTDRTLALASTDRTLVRTGRGVDEIELLFYSDEWLDFPLKCALAINGDITEISITLESPTTDDEWLARAVVDVPDEVLESAGALGVTVHGKISDDEYIVSALSIPLEIRQEGKDGGE